MILHIDASVRKDSRTRSITERLLKELKDDVYTEKLSSLDLKPLDEETLLWRDETIKNKDYRNSYFDLAKRFRDADTIVVTAPYYDLSFPSLLKLYFERITVSGLLFTYTDQGPKGFAKAKKLYYVVTSGGKIEHPEYSFGYVSDLCKTLYGIQESILIEAQMLDVWGMDPEKIINNTKIRL